MEILQQRGLDLESGASGLPEVIRGANHLRAMQDYGNHPLTYEATKQSFDQMYQNARDDNLAQLKSIGQGISTYNQSINKFHEEQNSSLYSYVSSGDSRTILDRNAPAK